MAGFNGTDVLVQINTGTQVTPVWSTVAAQRDFSRSESNDEIDFSSKDGRAWEGKAGRYSSDASLDGLVPVAASVGFDAMRTAMRAGNIVRLRTNRGGTPHEQADAIITSMDEEYPDQGESTFSASFKITGTWSAAT